jgi:hypothetical protein
MSATGIVLTPGGVNLSPGVLCKLVQAELGADFIGLYLGETLNVDLSNDILSWSGFGGPQFTNGTVDRLGRLFDGSRYYINCLNVGVLRYLTAPVAGCKSVITVAAAAVLPFINSYKTLLNGNADSPYVSDLVGTSNWIASAWIRYRDGVATDAITLGQHYWQSDNAASANNTLYVAGQADASRNWNGPMYAMLLSSAVPSAARSARLMSMFKQYYPWLP